jgi:hypothetical protein
VNILRHIFGLDKLLNERTKGSPNSLLKALMAFAIKMLFEMNVKVNLVCQILVSITLDGILGL